MNGENVNLADTYFDNQDYQIEFFTNIICDSWFYLLSVYDTIEILMQNVRQKYLKKKGLVRGTGASNERDEDLFEYEMDIVYNNQIYGCLKVRGGEDNLSIDDFINFIVKGAELRREIKTSMLIPDGLLFLSDGEIIWQNSTAEQILYRAEFEEEKEKILSDNDLIEPVVSVKNISINNFDLIRITIPVCSPKKMIGSFVIIADRSSKEELYHKAVIKEIHHRVKNNLQTVAGLLGLQMRRVKSRTVERAFQESINRISSIALIHEELSKGGIEKINIKTTLSNIMEMIFSTTVPPGKDITGEVEGSDIYADSKLVSMLSLCVTELLQNSVEHAFPLRKKGIISLKIEEAEGYITIIIEDDGVGFTKKRSKSSLGLEIIEMITSETLKGTFHIEGHMYGTQSIIKFPVV